MACGDRTGRRGREEAGTGAGRGGAVSAARDMPCLRWRDRRHSWRRTSEGGFDPGRYGIDVVGQPAAKAFVERHHYAGTFVSDRLRYGLFDLEDGGRLVGVAVLSVPGGSSKVLTSVFPRLAPGEESLELGRLVLLDEVASNGESFMVGEVLRLAARAGIRGVVSFSDPVARFDQDDRRVMPGHWGCTYQACNAVPVGRSWKRTHWVLPDGTFFSPVRMQKIRDQASGHEYAERLLIRWGARPMRAFEDPKAWLAEALRAACRDRDGNPRKFTHPGCIRYAWRTGETRAQRRAVHIAPEPTGYPKADVIIDGPRALALAA